MKLAISGKGGVGKATFTALLAQAYAERGREVLAVDADPSPCLAAVLGLPAALRPRLRPIAEMKELIEERTGAKPGMLGGFFTLNSRVDDIPERFSVVYRESLAGSGRSGTRREWLHLPRIGFAQSPFHAPAPAGGGQRSFAAWPDGRPAHCDPEPQDSASSIYLLALLNLMRTAKEPPKRPEA
ncbi:MAG: ArsA-related P-loop ATPase, partial [Anaerolineales bacterium]